MPGTAPAHIVCVHGLWMTGVEASFLRRRLRERHGYNTHQLHYRTVRASLSENAQKLRRMVEHELQLGQDAVCHYVGHSLGGLVVLKMLSDWPEAPPGHVVCLGTPLAGSAAAHRIASLPGGSSLLGKSIAEGVLAESASKWAGGGLGERMVGVIAGTHSIGLGRLMTKLPDPNDGTVAVEETHAPFVHEHMQVAATHTGLVTSREVAQQVAHFLARGHFRASAE